jgi:hypothetical protein
MTKLVVAFRLLTLLCRVCLSVRMEQLGWTERIFVKFGILIFLETISRGSKFHQYLTLMSGTSLEDNTQF